MGNNNNQAIIKLSIISTIIVAIVIVVYILLILTQKHTRDTRRISDVQTLYKALSIYQTLYGNFPVSAAPIKLDGSDMVSTALLNSQSIDKVVKDPLTPQLDYLYSTSPSGNDFTIQFCLESNSIKGYTKGCDNHIKP